MLDDFRIAFIKVKTLSKKDTFYYGSRPIESMGSSELKFCIYLGV